MLPPEASVIQRDGHITVTQLGDTQINTHLNSKSICLSVWDFSLKTEKCFKRDSQRQYYAMVHKSIDIYENTILPCLIKGQIIELF